MEPPSRIENQVYLNQIAAFCSGLTGALIKAGLTATQVNEVFAQFVETQCTECGIKLTGGELGSLALPTSNVRTTHPKLVRLRQGYCARQGCNARYYTLTLTPYPGLDWNSILQSVETPPSGLATDPQAASDGGATGARRRFVKVLAGVGIILFLLFCKFIMSGGSIPGFTHQHQYLLDTNSLSQGE